MRYLVLFFTIYFFTNCSGLIEEQEIDPVDYNEDWSSETHSSDADPDYTVVFPQNKVLRMDISIPAENWVLMQNDLDENLGSTGGFGGGFGGGPGGGPGGGSEMDGFDPVWVYADLKFEGKYWRNIGIRYKGNSSLQSVHNSFIDKYSFKLDFDEFEDDYPEINNQRFYGFKQLNLNNNYEDASVLHEKMAPEFFREFGLVAPQTAFVALYIDYGNASQYFGLYTLVEEVDNTVIKTQYTDGTGNLYKPENNGATFAYGTFNTQDMKLKTNTETANYSDVESLYNILHNSERNSETELWQAQLESVLDVPVFFRWLAANTTMQNWDTYGVMNHNYYLYNNPQSGKLEWIPWDNNEAFYEGKQGGAIEIDLSDVNSSWPLINYLAQVPEYNNLYKQYLNDFVNEVFTEEHMIQKVDAYYDLIREYVVSEDPSYTFTSEAAFENEMSALKQHVLARKNAVQAFIN